MRLKFFYFSYIRLHTIKAENRIQGCLRTVSGVNICTTTPNLELFSFSFSQILLNHNDLQSLLSTTCYGTQANKRKWLKSSKHMTLSFLFSDVLCYFEIYIKNNLFKIYLLKIIYKYIIFDNKNGVYLELISKL